MNFKLLFISSLITLILFSGCEKEENATIPDLTTDNVEKATANSAIVNYKITYDGGGSIKEHGVCWGTNQNPTIEDNKTINGTGTETGTGSFSSTITELEPNSIYNVRAYATNSAGTAYGAQLTVKTTYGEIEIITTAPTEITSSLAFGGGEIVNDGGGLLTAGICWSTSENPTIDNNKSNASVDVNGTLKENPFSVRIYNLEPNTTYYFKAFATNSNGIFYGGQKSFSTPPELASVIAKYAIDITHNSAFVQAKLENNGGDEIIEKGICYSKTNNPTIDNNKIIIDKQDFSTAILNLTPNTTYFVRAFATNNAGTSYSDNIFIKTYNKDKIFDIEGNEYYTVTIGEQIWMAENLKTTTLNDGTVIPNITDNSEWSALNTPAYCWNENDKETFKDEFGALYNWYTVNTQKVCPEGWRLPTDEDFNQLLGDDYNGTILREQGFKYWSEPWSNTSYSNTNKTGFTALPSGTRWNNGSFDSYFEERCNCYIWGYTSENSSFELQITPVQASVVENISKTQGNSIRCIKK